MRQFIVLCLWVFLLVATQEELTGGNGHLIELALIGWLGGVLCFQ
ncbi:MAG TPA: hypothetical protein PKE45_16080 [Caldilineaceae bacterium]|nr:hypothetical protein [Caldilineaceae bacterium]